MLQTKNGKFKMLQFTDIHIGEYPFNEEDQKSFDKINETLKETDADLIVITGDLMWSHGVDRPMRGYNALVDLFNQYDIPIIMTYGNHDSEESITRTDLRNGEANFKHLAEKKNAFVDSTNKETFNLEIFDENKKLKHVLYFFDSGSDSLRDDIEGYDWVTIDQVDHYEKVFNQYKKEGHSKADVVFLHIPVPEYKNAGEHIIEGKWWEMNPRIASPELNVGLFSRLQLNNHMLGMFCGHDHDNNFEGIYGSQRLIYGNVSGYNCYGVLPRGYREIILDGDKLETEIRLYK